MPNYMKQKDNAVADLGLHYAPSNLGNRNQPTKVGGYKPGKWATAVGFAVFFFVFSNLVPVLLNKIGLEKIAKNLEIKGAEADTQTQYPTADNSATGTWTITGAAARWDAVDEAAADTTTYINATAVGNALFNFTAFTVPAGSTITNLSISYRHEKLAAQACNIGASIRVNGVNYTVDAGVNPTNATWVTTTYAYTTNPNTGAAWTVADINGTGANPLQAFGVNSSDINPTPYVTQVYAVVTYTPPDTTKPTVDTFTATTPHNTDFNIPITAFTASDNVAVTGFQITTSATPPAAAAPPAGGWTATAPATYTVGADGTYTLYPWAEDLAGNVSLVFGTPRTVVVDTTAPTVSSTSPTNGATGVALNTSVTINWSENIDCATVNTTNITMSAGGWTFSTCGTNTATFTTSGQANSTTYTVTVGTNVKDANGKNMASSYPFSYTTTGGADGTPPITSNIQFTSPISGTYVGSPFNFTGDLDDDESNITACDYCAKNGAECTSGDTWVIGGGSLSGGPSPALYTCTVSNITTYSDTTAITSGQNVYIDVRGTSGGGTNTNGGTSVFKTMDKTAPTGPTNSSPSNGATNQSTSTSVVANAATDSGSGGVQYYFQVDIENTFTVADRQDSGWQAGTSYAPTLSNNITYYWHVKARDAVGNETSYTTTWSFTTEAAPLANPPADVNTVSASPGNNQVTVSWTTNPPTCGTDDYRILLILRNTAPIIDKPLDNQTYAAGPNSWIGSSLVVKSNVAALCTAPPATSPYIDTGLAAGQRYYYKVFTGSATPRYSTGKQTYATPTGTITSGGTGTLLRRTSPGDNTCGGEFNACHNMKTHNSANTESTYWTGNWGTTGGQYGKIVCQTCHQPHSTRNIYIIKPRISFPDNSPMPNTLTWATVDYRKRSDEAETDPNLNYSKGYDTSARTTSFRVCEVCHSKTLHHRYNSSTQTDGWNHKNGQNCTNCHDHQKGFKKGGKGGADCGDCHQTQADPMKGTSPGDKTYHMVMEDSNINAIAGGIGTGSKYPNKPQPTVASSHKRCLYCHAEMENFDKDINPSNPGMAYNLRKTILSAPSTTTDTAQLSNTDFITTASDGGICTSCHMYAQTKDTIKRTAVDRAINTPVIDPTSFRAATHNFNVNVPFSDATTFLGNCVKCHNDTLGKSSVQTGAYKFGMHDSELRRLNAPMSLSTTSTGDKGADKGTPTSATTTVINDTGKSWTTNAWTGRGITISAGTGSNQTRVVKTNTPTSITVTNAFSPAPNTSSYYLLGDPIEEELCFRCHSTSTTSNPKAGSYSDYYGAQSFKNTRAMKMEQVFNTTNNPYGHKISDYSGIHQTDEFSKAPANATASGWFTYFSGGAKHVGCADCHNPHAARKPGGNTPGDVADNKKGNGVATGATNTANITISETTKNWTTNEWRGYVLRILSGSGAAQDRMIMSNNTNTIVVFTSWETGTDNAYPGANSFYIISPLGHPQYGNMLSNANDDIWGVTIGANWPAAPTPSNTQETYPSLVGTFFSKKDKLVGNQDKVYNLCFKCHSAYGWGTSGTPFTIPYAPTTTGQSADIAARFNPNNLAHHAVYEKGRNQPIVANYNSTSNSSYNPNWPSWKIAGASTITINSGSATLSSSMPSTVLPGWFVWVGNANNDNPNNGAATVLAGASNRGFFEITGITSLTQFSVTPANVSVTTSVFAITAGFGNNFVPPYGPWSRISCTDCHDTDNSSDPSGPHASANKWILRKMETQDFPWYNGTNVIRVRWVPPAITAWTNASVRGNNILCVNCHRADVYGITGNEPQDHAVPPAGNNFINFSAWRGTFARQLHAPDPNAGQMYDDTDNYSTVWRISCMNCHGGGSLLVPNSKVGQIHGTNLGYSTNLTGAVLTGGSYSYRGKRFLTGASWYGVIRSSTGAAGSCWVVSGTNDLQSCSDNVTGTMQNSANYDYESGADYSN